MSAGTFACIIAMRRRGRSLEKIADLNGLAQTDPMLALAFAVFMFSLAGIPPLSGFFGKLYVFLAAVQAGNWWLAVIGVVTSVVAAYYYIRIVKVMYFDPAEPAFDRRTASLSFVAAASALFTLAVLHLPGADRGRGPDRGAGAGRDDRPHGERDLADAAGHRRRQHQHRLRRA